MKNEVNQCAVILDHLMKHRFLTRKEAKEKYNIECLSSRIVVLRGLGILINTTPHGYTLPYYKRMKGRAEESSVMSLFGE